MLLNPHTRYVFIAIKWLALAIAAGLLAGTASAGFLALLEGATELRMTHGWLLWLLPIGGAIVSWMYSRYGKEAGKGNNLLLERIYESGGTAVPLRMAPLVLFGTVVTHLFGGSAGREGTAVQMGGSLADGLSRRIGLSAPERQILLMCGISSGFGSVFGTPLAGAVFALEVVALGFLHYRAAIPCLLASFAGHFTVLAWGVRHASYSWGEVPAFSLMLLLKIVIASILFGLTAWLFSALTHRIKAMMTKWFPNAPLKSFIGGAIIIALVFVFGTRDYLGLGLPLLEQSFEQAASPIVFIAKLLFTTVTLGAGFQGGEVTPLFVIGSTLGSTLGGLLSASVPLLAGIGLIAVFGAAANTPLASVVMGIELFGIDGFGPLYMLIGCAIAYFCSGRGGIYSSQRPRFQFMDLRK
ncbi:voltage-gated chloride channel family protein [Paenibacillus gorillae]|uniref:voltage-gated chloride channel family protein n=1 Tax=Paenibacillus gorillae TaxID=1243662 RepID=UPI0004B9F6CD|nr:voltage-gated chloride channel family protein [Paenibacillus gorillae]